MRRTAAGSAGGPTKRGIGAINVYRYALRREVKGRASPLDANNQKCAEREAIKKSCQLSSQ